MDVGEIALHALLCILCSALVYLWFLSSCILPTGMSVLDIETPTEIHQAIKSITPP